MSGVEIIEIWGISRVFGCSGDFVAFAAGETCAT